MGDRGECFVTVVFIKEWEAFVGEKLDPKMLAYMGFEPGTLGMRSAGTDRSATIGTDVESCTWVLMWKDIVLVDEFGVCCW